MPEPTPTKHERREAARAERLAREQAAAASDTRRKRLLTLLGLLGAAAVIVVVAVVISSGGSKSKTSSTASGTVQGVAETKALIDGIPQSGVTLGKADAPATVVEFADPQCPFCKDYTLNEMPSIVKKYVRTGKAKMELRYLTFIGPDSITAANALEAAGLQNKLWDASDLLYRNQGEENSGYVTQGFLKSILTAAGADATKALNAASSSAVSQQLGDAKTLASRYGVTGTPTILVGPTGGTLKKDAESAPTAAGVGQMIDAVVAGKAGT